MAYQCVFKRYELKYVLTSEQKAKVLTAIQPYMTADSYGRTTIRNVYYDTDNYRLIRNSIEKPTYKEKLRLRSYTATTPDSTVFVELKKKFDGVVYKRRLSLSEKDALDWLDSRRQPLAATQITSEIDYFLSYYRSLRRAAFISYDREAFYSSTDCNLRLTLDTNILCRTEDFSFASRLYGTPILDDDLSLMEIKCAGGIPLWLVRTLSAEGIVKTSFSKYGRAYQQLIYPTCKGAL